MTARLLEIGGADGTEVAVGASVAGDERNELGPEVAAFVEDAPDRSARDAVTVLTDVPPGTTIATIGQQSNLAAALVADKSLPTRVDLLAVMGGAFGPIRTLDGRSFGPERDWNLILDPPGAARSLSAGWRALYVPIDVSFHAVLRTHQLERLRGGDDLCRVVAALVDAWRARGLEFADAPELADVAAFLHDPLTIACIVERSFVTVERLPVTVALDARGAPRTFVDPLSGHEADVVRSVDAPAFADWVVDTLLDS